jgi:hypothetical protein
MEVMDAMMSNEELQEAINSLMQHLLNHKGHTPIDPMVQQLKALFEIQLQRAATITTNSKYANHTESRGPN